MVLKIISFFQFFLKILDNGGNVAYIVYIQNSYRGSNADE